MIAPDPKRRANILQKAQAEAEAFAAFKQRNALKSVHEVNRLGGNNTKMNVNQARDGFLQNAQAEAKALAALKRRNALKSVHEVNYLGGNNTKMSVNQAREGLLHKYASSDRINKN